MEHSVALGWYMASGRSRTHPILVSCSMVWKWFRVTSLSAASNYRMVMNHNHLVQSDLLKCVWIVKHVDYRIIVNRNL